MKILITDKMAEEAVKELEAAGHDVTFDEMDHDRLLDTISDYDALMIRSRTKVTEDIVRKGAKGKLKVIGRVGIGVDNIDIKTAGSLGIKVVNAPTGATISVAELAIAHMLSLSRHLTKADRTMKQGEWAKKQLKGSELYGKTLGLVGSGGIAQYVSKLANGFGMNVLVYSPNCTEEKTKKMNATLATFEEVLRKSDFVSLNIPHTKDTHYLIDEKSFDLMKKSAFFIDVSRGGVTDQKALYEALKEGKIAGAALDVFEKEPPGDTKLTTLDNIVLTPHIGASTTEGQIRAGTVCAEQVIKVLNDETPDHWVNKAMMV